MFNRVLIVISDAEVIYNRGACDSPTGKRMVDEHTRIGCGRLTPVPRENPVFKRNNSGRQ